MVGNVLLSMHALICRGLACTSYRMAIDQSKNVRLLDLFSYEPTAPFTPKKTDGIFFSRGTAAGS